MKSGYQIIPLAILIVCIVIFGFTFSTNSSGKSMIPWSDRALTWEDFREVNSMEEDYVATIYSHIICPDLITDANSKVTAYMNPNLSERLLDEYDGYNVLVHEQYHFNLTEYCARLLRKDIVERGLGGLSFQTMKTLKTKYTKKLDSLQNAYDSITDHNANWESQRYWELQIDDWLRQTASYKNEDIYSYYDFTKNRTNFFKNIYFTLTQKVLTSYPVGENEKDFGEVYEIIYPSYESRETIIKFYKDGQLTNGGYFEAAVTKIVKKEKDIHKVYYYKSEENYENENPSYFREIGIDENKNRIVRFYSAAGEPIYRSGVYKIHWDYNADERAYYTTYFNQNGNAMANKYGIHHEKRTLDKKERTVSVENFDHQNRPKNDDSYIARYDVDLSDNHVALFKRLYDESGAFATHLSDYHLAYAYDEKGRRIKITSLDANGEKTYDHNGASIYEYTYDRHDRQTSVKRFNAHHSPIIADDDYFQRVSDYDDRGRIVFQAEYYPEYVLRFSDEKDGALKYVYENDTIKKILNVDAYNTIFENDLNVAITVQTLNSNKRVTKEMYLNANENFAKTEDDAVIYRYKYDVSGNRIETAVYDSIDQPKEFEADVATIRWNYDAHGNKTKTTYFTKNDELAFANDSITYNFYSFNKEGKLTERTNYDKQMQPAELEGTFKTIFHLNKAGSDSLVFWYDSKNKLKKGVAITKYFYNKLGQKIREEYYDRNHKRTLNKGGISAITYDYNQRGLLVGYEYLDKSNRLTNTTDGVAQERWNLDDLGYTQSYSYYDQNRKPVLSKYGYHKVEYQWDAIGEISKSTTYGTDNKLIVDEYGTAIYTYRLAPSGLKQTIERYNDKEVLAANTNNVAITEYEPGLNGLYYLDKELDAMGEVVNDSIPD